ncbi:MAG: phosphodiester glycosidase family protein [Proteobacteria bacterium]|nr:phosphodiester glycosidase family protein [Pseudomonadota bacterium]
MRILMKAALISALLMVAAFSVKAKWRKLEPGLDWGVFWSPQISEIGDSMIRVLRIDPERFEFRLLNASVSDKARGMTAREWCRRNGLVAAINASMYQSDLKTSVSLMRTRTHVNNARLSKDKTILAFDSLKQDVRQVTIIDRECEDFNTVKKGYSTFVQSIRMISCQGKNVWSQRERKWSTAAVGMDRQGRILFIHVRSPYSTHDLINILKTLPIAIVRAMYVEGGSEAQLYVNSGNHEFELVGSNEAGFSESSGNSQARPIPNVIGIAAKNRASSSGK